MVIIKMWGGLGNQLFLYALYHTFLKKGIDTKIDLSYYDQFNIHNGYELPQIFNLNANYASAEECRKLANIKLDFKNRLLKRIYHKKTHYLQRKTGNMGYDNTILNLENMYLEGYFQSENYFKEYENDIRALFTFPTDIGEDNNRILNKIQNEESVSLHIRRGDYLKNKKGILPLSESGYYSNAIDYINKVKPNCTLYVFSNDIDWCKQNISGENIHYVDNNKDKSSYIDLYLMSQCKHNIIADSSFSWWGAWLNSNQNKIIIAPDQWIPQSGFKFNNIIPNDWKLIKR